MHAVEGESGDEPLLPRRSRCALTFASIIALTSSISGFSFGYEIGIIDGVLAMPSFRLYFGTALVSGDDGFAVVESESAADTAGWIVSSFLLGAMIGSALAAFSADAFGRRSSILLGGTFFAVGGALQAAAGGLASLIFGRILSGVGVGLMSSVSPLFIAETAAPVNRGKLVAAQQLLITVGIFCASTVNAIILGLSAASSGTRDDKQWRAALAAQVIPGLLVVILVARLPESPRWLVARGRTRDAANVIAALREKAADSKLVADEVAGIVKEMEGEGFAPPPPAGVDPSDVVGGEGEKDALASTGRAAHAVSCVGHCVSLRGRVLELFASGDSRRRALLVVGLQVWQQLTGINIILYYAADLMERAGAASREQAATTLVVANSALLIFGTLPGMALLDNVRVGRRGLLIYGAFAMAATHVAFAMAVLAGSRTPTSALAYTAVAAMMTFTVAFSATWGPTVWVFVAEALPLRVRGAGIAIGTLANWSTNALIGKFAPLCIKALGGWTYIILALLCALMGVYSWALVPETAGRSLEDVALNLWGGAGKNDGHDKEEGGTAT